MYRDSLITTGNPDFERKVELAGRRREAHRANEVRPRRIVTAVAIGFGCVALGFVAKSTITSERETIRVGAQESAYTVAERALSATGNTDAAANPLKVNEAIDELVEANPDLTEGSGPNIYFEYEAELILPEKLTPQN